MTRAKGRDVEDIGVFPDGAESGCELEDYQPESCLGHCDAGSLRQEKLAEVGYRQDSTTNQIDEIYPLNSNVSDVMGVQEG